MTLDSRVSRGLWQPPDSSPLKAPHTISALGPAHSIAGFDHKAVKANSGKLRVLFVRLFARKQIQKCIYLFYIPPFHHILEFPGWFTT